MGRPKKVPRADQDVLYVRLEPGNMKFIYGVVLESKQPIRAVVDMMVSHCRRSKTFSVPVRETVAEKAVAAQKEREEKLRAKVAGEE